MQPWVPAWSSPPLLGMAAGMALFGAPAAAGAGTGGVSVPGRAAAGAQHSLTMQTATSSPPPRRFGGQEAPEVNLLGGLLQQWRVCGEEV